MFVCAFDCSCSLDVCIFIIRFKRPIGRVCLDNLFLARVIFRICMEEAYELDDLEKIIMTNDSKVRQNKSSIFQYLTITFTCKMYTIILIIIFLEY